MESVSIQKLSREELEQKGVFSWPIWEKEVSRFDWKYDNEEHCWIIEGEIRVEAEGKTYAIKAGDYVIFRKGLACVWEITKEVRKHYAFV